MLDAFIHRAAEALTVLMGLITLMHEAMLFLKKAPFVPLDLRPSGWTLSGPKLPYDVSWELLFFHDLLLVFGVNPDPKSGQVADCLSAARCSGVTNKRFCVDVRSLKTKQSNHLCVILRWRIVTSYRLSPPSWSY